MTKSCSVFYNCDIAFVIASLSLTNFILQDGVVLRLLTFIFRRRIVFVFEFLFPVANQYRSRTNFLLRHDSQAPVHRGCDCSTAKPAVKCEVTFVIP